MTVWVVRAGADGEREELAEREACAVIGFNEVGDLTLLDAEMIRQALRISRPLANANAVGQWTGQLLSFRDAIVAEDLIVLPLIGGDHILVGKAEGQYEYKATAPAGARHRRSVTGWERVPRTEFDTDVLDALNVRRTVYRPQAVPDIEERIAETIRQYRAAVERSNVDPTATPRTIVRSAEELGQEVIDIETSSLDRIQRHIGERFVGHDLTRLVEGVLKARGFYTFRSPPGPDGGVDILAGLGSMGFDHPRLCVQVKSGRGVVDVSTARELAGVMQRFNASQGLMVAWGGFTAAAQREARESFFRMRLWDARELTNAVLEVYDQLSPELQTELPLKRVWLLVVDSVTSS